MGDQLNILPAGATNLIVAASIVSLTLNPLQYKGVDRAEEALRRRPSLWRFLNRASGPPDAVADDSDRFRAVVVGYGPIGKTLARLLKDGGIQPVIIETNIDTTRAIRNDGHLAVYGDAERPEVLDAAGIRSAVALVVSGPAAGQSAEIIRQSRAMNPPLRVLARSQYLRESPAMFDAGADEVFSGEGEVALAMTEHILGVLGATAEQQDRERLRVREEVFRISRTRA
jgi:CPA2 family monovalent cation:H+ antiporter-2